MFASHITYNHLGCIHPSLSHFQNQNHEQLSFTYRYLQKCLRCVIYICLFVAVAFLILLVYVTIALLNTDNSGIEYDDAKFFLYKNTMF